MAEINERYFPDEEKITRFGFIKHMESYMKELLNNPLSAKPDPYLEKYGIDYKIARKMLFSPTKGTDPESSVMKKNEKIVTGPDGKDKFVIKYNVMKGYENKLRNIFIEKFESNIIDELNLNEEEGSCAAPVSGGEASEPIPNSGAYETALTSKIIKKPVYNPKGVMEGKKRKQKTIYISEKHLHKLKEATDTASVGAGKDLVYPAFGDRETCDHHNIMKKSFPGYGA